jgi:3-phenylpropionate/trans-cinnamate dioxygenase ferredoxin subunit
VSDRFMTVAKVGEIPEGGIKLVRVDDEPVAVFHVGGAYYALGDVCTHDGGPLVEGLLDGYEIECPRHGARFDIRTGAALSLPAASPAPVHTVRVIGDQVQVACETCDEKRFAHEAAAVGAAATPAPAGAAPSRGEPSHPAGHVPEPSSRAAVADAASAKPAGPAPAAPAPAPVPPIPGAETPAPSQQEFAIRAALETVMDPEIELSVIDLGLVREVRIEPGRTLVRMLLTTPFCPYAPQLAEDVKQAARSVVDQPCEVEILPDAWSPEMMPDPGLLGFSY